MILIVVHIKVKTSEPGDKGERGAREASSYENVLPPPSLNIHHTSN